jgi:hypothetical protein
MHSDFYWFLVCFNNISFYRGGQFYWWRKSDDQEKTTDLSQVTDKFYHMMLYTSLWSTTPLKFLQVKRVKICSNKIENIVKKIPLCLQTENKDINLQQ